MYIKTQTTHKVIKTENVHNLEYIGGCEFVFEFKWKLELLQRKKL